MFPLWPFKLVWTKINLGFPSVSVLRNTRFILFVYVKYKLLEVSRRSCITTNLCLIKYILSIENKV